MQILQKLDTMIRKYGVWFFYFGLFYTTIGAGWLWFTDTTPDQIRWHKDRFLTFGIYLCCLRIILFLRQYPIYTLFSLSLLALFHWMTYHVCHDTIIYTALLPALAAKDADAKKILYVVIGSFIFLLIATIPLYLLGWSGDILKHQIFLVGHSWGFGNPNLLGILLAALFFAILILWLPREKWKLWTICLTGAFLIYAITLCATAAIAMLALPLIYYLIQRFPLHPLIWAMVPLLCLTISIGLSLYFGPSFGETTFESRFSMPYLLLQEKGISWMGQDCELIPLRTVLEEGIDAICLDNCYLRLPLQYGIIPSIIVYLLLSCNIYLIAKQKSPFVLAVALCFLLLGFTESYAIMSRINFTLMFGLAAWETLLADHLQPERISGRNSKCIVS